MGLGVCCEPHVVTSKERRYDELARASLTWSRASMSAPLSISKLMMFEWSFAAAMMMAVALDCARTDERIGAGTYRDPALPGAWRGSSNAPAPD